VMPLTEWVVRSACMQLRAWCDGLPRCTVADAAARAAERGDLPRLIHDSLSQAGWIQACDGQFARRPNARDATRRARRCRCCSDGVRQFSTISGRRDHLSGLSQYPLAWSLRLAFLRGWRATATCGRHRS